MKIVNINLVRRLGIVVFAISFNGILCFSGYAYESFFEKGREIKYKGCSPELKKIPSAKYDTLFPQEGIRVKKKMFQKKSNSQSYKQSLSGKSKLSSVLSNIASLKKGKGMEDYNPNKNIKLCDLSDFSDFSDLMADLAPTLRLGVDPLSIKEAAQENGYKASIVNKGTLEELAYLIDHGILVIALGQWEDKNSGNYMAVIGYERENGNITTIYLKDAAGGTFKQYDADKFVNDFWENDAGIKGAKCLFIAIAPKNSEQAKYLPADRYENIMTPLTILNGLNNTITGIMGAFYPFRDGKFIGFGHWIENIAHAPFQIAGGITKVSGGLIGGGLQWVGDKIEGDVGDFISGIGKGITNISTGIGNTIMDIGEGIIEGVKDVWDSIF